MYELADRVFEAPDLPPDRGHQSVPPFTSQPRWRTSDKREEKRPELHTRIGHMGQRKPGQDVSLLALASRLPGCRVLQAGAAGPRKSAHSPPTATKAALVPPTPVPDPAALRQPAPRSPTPLRGRSAAISGGLEG
ncbi:hypothetical protein PtA15_5A636 [Puccinia triticina]|uniref:Uncharacterized protein n=1 Tax=Puccinia triticina TaxID=208348 RepID=A0ABY7CQQ5_9BASI|nr:uncharacterized protein PtA15_5A636 [Puccinia triticina]WAQ85062.1 hypothetical protein PtA15_5A636 [Puccinia triticina]WAR58392.1 hypothetical protein PtB15_5B626 [Puccinia triticina]